MKYIIKLADEKDIDKLAFFWNNIIQNHWNVSAFNCFPKEQSGEFSEKYSSKSLLKKIEQNNDFIYIIKENEKIIGTLNFSKDPDQNNVFVGSAFQVLPEFQAKKYGKFLAKKAITDISNMPCERIELSTCPYNRKAIPYYKRLGFFWVPDTSVFMKNYLPLIYKTSEAREFFRKNDWYDSLKNNITLEPDLIIENGIKVFKYVWENNNEILRTTIDSEKDIIKDIDYKKSKNKKSNIINFESLTGINIKIGIIDSGIDSAHHDVREVKGGINLLLDENKKIITNENYSDKVGHGTACAGLIRKKAKDAEIYSIKIFQDESLNCNLKVLIEGIKWAVDNGIKIINLSLGTVENKNVSGLFDVCEYAKNNSVFIIASDTNENIISYPSVFLNTIGVTGGKIKGSYIYHFDSASLVPFIARGDRQRLAWTNNDYIFLGGTSFAAPHITAIAALILESNPEITFNEMYELLISNAKTTEVEIVKDKSLYLEQKSKNEKTKSDLGKEDKIEIKTKKYGWIKRACIYPFNKEMHALVRARDLTDFEITAIADPVGKGLVGKDAGEAIGINKIGITIEHNLKNALSKADTLILSHVNELSRISGKDIFRDSFLKAIELNKNVFFLDPKIDIHDDIFKQAEEKKLIVDYPKLDKVDYNNTWKNRNKQIKVPVIGVFGTSSHQGKFTVQLALRRLMLHEGYKVTQIGTEPHSELFGFDYAFPMGYESIINWTENFCIIHLHDKIFNLTNNNKSDIVIVGAQSGIIPVSIKNIENLTLHSISFLFGTKPDAYILCVNSIDEYEFIHQSISTLNALGKGKTVLLVMSNQEKIIKNIYGKTFIQTKKENDDELQNKLKKLEKEFNIPATEVITDEGQKKMFNAVIKYFAK